MIKRMFEHGSCIFTFYCYIFIAINTKLILQGEPGEPGSQGSPGPAGPSGLPGYDGLPGKGGEMVTQNI